MYSELKDRGYSVNHKVVERLHSCWDLSVIRSIKAPKGSFIRALLKDAGESISLVASLGKIDDFEVFYTDFTEIIYCYGEKKAYLMPIIDHSSRYSAGHALGANADTQLALKA